MGWRFSEASQSAVASASPCHPLVTSDGEGGAPRALPPRPRGYFVGWNTAYADVETMTLFAPSLTYTSSL